ncbi:MAG TPA: hypothetical protein VER11_12540 [Polyangiaceae bacterium]|nr:hypothetical protein [Polyangiaceae bacterium]
MADERALSADRGSAGSTSIDEVIAQACEPVPGVENGALVLLAEGMLLGGFGSGRAFDREPLVRAAVRCLGASNALPRPSQSALEFIEYAFVTSRQIVVILRGAHRPTVALALVCARESNLAFVLGAARRALGYIEANVELDQWGI